MPDSEASVESWPPARDSKQKVVVPPPLAGGGGDAASADGGGGKWVSRALTLFRLDGRRGAIAKASRLAADGDGGEDVFDGSASLDADGRAVLKAIAPRSRLTAAAVRTASDAAEAVGLVRSSAPRPPLWLRLIATLLQGGVSVARELRSGISVLVHCSDGWDRTPALTSLAQILVDPYFRTVEGLCVLLQKEWCSFGHRFARRNGTGASDHDRADADDGQRAPVFVQFVDSLWQLRRQQARGALEWTDDLLVAVAEHSYSACFGTFLHESEKDRSDAGVPGKTQSLWSYLLHPMMRSRFFDPSFVATASASAMPLVLNAEVGDLIVWPFWRARFT
jgi:hypothetical protein